MKKMYRSWMNTTAGACSAQACSAASMESACAIVLGTAAVAVSFLSAKLLEALRSAVRIIL